MAAPVLKYAGGKTRLLPELLSRLPRGFAAAASSTHTDSSARYYEPFVGGAALFLRLEPRHAVINDINADLVSMYRSIQTNVEQVIACLRDHKRAHDAEGATYYYRVREIWNNPRVSWLPSQRAAAFIYLNKTCFNGLHRVNSKGEFNVPAGSYKNPTILDEGALRATSRALASTTILAGDYRAAIADVRAGDFVYFDSPYDETFVGYAAGGFTKDDQRALAGLVRELVARGVRVMLSNSDTPFVRDLYARYRIDTVRCARAINADGAGRGAVNEVIVMAGYEPAGTAPEPDTYAPEPEIARGPEAAATLRG